MPVSSGPPAARWPPALVARVGGTAGEGGLAGVVAQGARPHGQQQIGVVGKFPGPCLGMRPGEQHQHGRVTAGPGSRGR